VRINWEALRIEHGYGSVKYMIECIHKKQGDLYKTAKFLGMSRPTLRKKMKELGIGLEWGGSRPHPRICDDVPPEWFVKYTPKEIARRKRCKVATVWRYLRYLRTLY